ncbi:right-handed parallel beta-helix repeat-containing protein [Leadbettera azotonutricia]|uniref:DUF1565 domain-containing protein n=1 Tax=Leadbettera azotonutricia (strain ATCC BAA-888 / DSM 13862 / ZAS-9) TaxID=545695 RepID=F5Y936_LEAAZ|nr:right-handed parallel beta-helix repeat-containing protein [Leadbettera azotonutricia]AEF80721.1 conserved hypothetical protein [Leadbettera azotonutricia ZAS-9]
MKKMKKVLFLASAILLIAAATAAAADLYVSVETGESFRSADGSKAKPYKDLQAALDKAADGDTIHIAKGNYLGTSDRGYIEVLKAVSLKGGYTTDFSKRDVLANRTTIQPTPASNGTAGAYALLNLGKKGTVNGVKPAGEMIIDGIILDKGNSLGYHATNGKPAGVATGMLVIPPAKGENNGTKDVIGTVQPTLWFDVTGKLTIQNCVFVNGNQYAIMGNANGATIKIINNLFINNTYAAVQISSRLATGNYGNTVDFSYNTVLFNWNRTADNQDLGLGTGYRFMTGVNTDVHHNIIGLSHRAGLDRTRTETPANETKRKTGAEDNYFFLNKMGDIELPGGGMGTRVWAKNFEEREELYKYDRNEELTTAAAGGFKGKLNAPYLEGFLNATYTETTDYDANSSANNFRRAMGLNQSGSMTTKVSMYANRYPLDDALKLFGAVSGKGAQAIKN